MFLFDIARKMLDFFVISKKKSRAKEYSVELDGVAAEVIEIISTLKANKFEAYIVGGGVRDLLLGFKPKDFDIVTNAKPEQIRRLFKYSMIIGKRFRLVHVRYGRGKDDFIEVATYRSNKRFNFCYWKKHKQNNYYGDVFSDAKRRDFTLNALLYDVNRKTVIDYVGGYEHLKDKIIHIIGEPWVRFKDDPVRILRAVRFAAKLNFKLSQDVEQVIIEKSKVLIKANVDRMYLEVIKLFYSGHAVASWQLLKKYNLLQYIFPDLAKLLVNQHAARDVEKLFNQVFIQSDKRFVAGYNLSNAFLFAVMYWPLWQQVKKKIKSRRKIILRKQMQNVLYESRSHIAISNRLCEAIIFIWELQGFLHKSSHSKLAFNFIDHARFRAALDFFVLRAKAGNASSDKANWWLEFSLADDEKRKSMVLSV